MKKSTLLWTAIIILFLLNAGTLFFILSKPHPPRHERGDGRRKFDEQVIETLQLRPDQVEKFEQLKRAHHEQILQLDEATRAPFEQYFGLLAQGSGADAAKDSLERVIALQYVTRMQVTYRHFSDLKAICDPEQQKKFEQLVPSLMQVMSAGEKKPDQHRRKN